MGSIRAIGFRTGARVRRHGGRLGLVVVHCLVFPAAVTAQPVTPNPAATSAAIPAAAVTTPVSIAVPIVPSTSTPNATTKPKLFVAEMNAITDSTRYEQLREVIGRTSLGSVRLRWSRQDRLSTANLLATAPETEVRVRCFLDLSQRGKATLYFADRHSTRFLYRELKLNNDLDALESETLAQMVELSISALLDDSTVALSRAEAVALLAPPKGPANRDKVPTIEPSSPGNERPFRPTSFRPSLGARYAIESYSEQLGWVQAPGLVVGTTLDSAAHRYGLVLNAAYVLSNSYRTQLVGAELSGLRLLTEVSFVTPFSLSAHSPYGSGLGLALGAGIERTHIVPVKGNASASTVLFGPRWLTTPVLSASVRLNYEFSRHWTAALGGYVNATLLDVSCELETADGTQRVLTTRRLRPGLLLELGWQ